MDNSGVRDVQVALRTILVESMLESLGEKNDGIVSYGIESFARILAQRLTP